MTPPKRQRRYPQEPLRPPPTPPPATSPPPPGAGGGRSPREGRPPEDRHRQNGPRTDRHPEDRSRDHRPRADRHPEDQHPETPSPQRRPPDDNPPEDTAPGDGRPGGNPERFYVIGGADGERAGLDLVTLIVARAEDPPPSTAPEQAAVLRLCAAPLSVAELSAYLSLPYSAVTVLLTEMLAAELVHARAPIVRQALADRSLLEAVMHGLQRL